MRFWRVELAARANDAQIVRILCFWVLGFGVRFQVSFSDLVLTDQRLGFIVPLK